MPCRHFSIDRATGFCRDCGEKPTLETRSAPAFLRDDAAMQWHLAKQAFYSLTKVRGLQSETARKWRKIARAQASIHLEAYAALRQLRHRMVAAE